MIGRTGAILDPSVVCIGQASSRARPAGRRLAPAVIMYHPRSSCGWIRDPLLYIVTVHYGSPRWIEIQTKYLREHVKVPYQTWSSLEQIDPSYGVHFDRVFVQQGRHPGKLNHLALEISHIADDDDLLMFLDGDAFPIADPMPLIEDGLSRAPLIAVRRAENVDAPQPHPSFCVTTVGTWRRLPGDWSGGPTWPGAKGGRVTDVGGSLLRELELSEVPWVQVLRSNRTDIDPLYFGVYGDVIYHHGAGFRTGELSGAHSDTAPELLPRPRAPWRRPITRLINRHRWRTWESTMQQRHIRQSQEIYERIEQGGTQWLSEFI